MNFKQIWERFGAIAEAIDAQPIEAIERRLRRVEQALAELSAAEPQKPGGVETSSRRTA